MRILWIVNIELPAISLARGRTVNPLEGWLTGVLNQMKKDQSNHLTICYPDSLCEEDYIKGVLYDNVDYVAFREYRTTRSNYLKLNTILQRIVEEIKPDVVHIHGTECMHSCDMSEITYGRIPTAISIQGLLTPLSFYYCCGVPGKIKNKVTIRSLINRDFMLYDLLSLKKRSKYEQKALQHTDFVIGRTDWDNAYTTWMAPQAQYRKCNETLRDTFYAVRWNYDNCEKNTIFVSQSDSPMKGFHFLLRALAKAKVLIPDVKIYAIGTEKNPKYLQSDKNLNVYQQYIYKLIKDNNLEDNVIFLGRLDELSIATQLQKTNIFICPSGCENSPNSLGEAMLLGVPCLAADVGGISSLMSNKKEGILYRCDDVELLAFYIVHLLQNVEMSIQYGIAARQRALTTHDPGINYKQLLDIYYEMRSKKGKAYCCEGINNNRMPE